MSKDNNSKWNFVEKHSSKKHKLPIRDTMLSIQINPICTI